ncbi:MAG: hypothetical protein ACYC5M_03420 [Anaerolineae bacterium]
MSAGLGASLQDIRDRFVALYPFRGTIDEYQPIEGVVRGALQPVGPSAGFRENLRGNLNIAVERKVAGVVIERGHSFRAGIIIGISAGVATALIATIFFLLRPRTCRSQG